jgi:hypothetical protein
MRADVGVSDADIIGKTVFEQNEQGHTKFKYTLPSGRVVESEWLNDDQRKKAREAWLSVVCDQIGLDREEQRARDKRVVEERKLKETPPVPEVKPGSIIMVENDPSRAIITQQTIRDRLDPHSFARDSLEEARKNLAYWRVQAEAATKNLARAQRDLEQWQTIVNQLIVKDQGDTNE